MFDVPDKITDHVNLRGSRVGEKINADKFTGNLAMFAAIRRALTVWR
jgi:hypothetical protein